LASSVHVVIVLCNITMAALLVTYLYLQQPGTMSTQSALRRYFTDGYYSDARRLRRRAIAANAVPIPQAADAGMLRAASGSGSTRSLHANAAAAASAEPAAGPDFPFSVGTSHAADLGFSSGGFAGPGSYFVTDGALFSHPAASSAAGVSGSGGFGSLAALSPLYESAHTKEEELPTTALVADSAKDSNEDDSMDPSLLSPPSSPPQTQAPQPHDARTRSHSLTGTFNSLPVGLRSYRELRNTEVDLSSANPLRLLVFHLQQLSLLLLTATSLPSSLSGLLTVFSSAGNGFSMSSLTAMECLVHWTLVSRSWAALLAPSAVGVVALITWVRGQWLLRRSRTTPTPFSNSASSITSRAMVLELQSTRIYSVCVSLLYLMFFPCAQTALTALGCTDRREEQHGEPNPQVYLVLAPWQACNSQWQRDILPPALLATIWWTLVFPAASTLMLYRLHTRLSRAGPTRSDSSNHLYTWSLVSELLKPYMPRLWYWEQILLLRRLALVATITLVPSQSLYLPLILFAIVQLSALLQMWARPYRSTWLNRAELISLYLLLLNYISALVNQSSPSAVNVAADNDANWLLVSSTHMRPQSTAMQTTQWH